MKNLFPKTSYRFRVTSGDENGYNTEGGAVITVGTYITRTRIAVDQLYLTLVCSCFWPSTRRAVYGFAVAELDCFTARDLLLAVLPRGCCIARGCRQLYAALAHQHKYGNLPLLRCGLLTACVLVAETTSAVIGDLEPGRAYEVLILAGNEDGEEQVGTRMILTTLSTTDNVVADPSLGTNGTIIAAASASAVVVLIVIIVVVVVVIRRRQRATNEKLEEFGGAGGLVRLLVDMGYTDGCGLDGAELVSRDARSLARQHAPRREHDPSFVC